MVVITNVSSIDVGYHTLWDGSYAVERSLPTKVLRSNSIRSAPGAVPPTSYLNFNYPLLPELSPDKLWLKILWQVDSLAGATQFSSKSTEAWSRVGVMSATSNVLEILSG
jgi:hypothetical protein